MASIYAGVYVSLKPAIDWCRGQVCSGRRHDVLAWLGVLYCTSHTRCSFTHLIPVVFTIMYVWPAARLNGMLLYLDADHCTRLLAWKLFFFCEQLRNSCHFLV